MDNLPNNKPCPHCGRYNNRAVTIDAVVVHADKVLLIKRGSEPFKEYWALPGGHVDWDETLEETVKREVKEELGVEVTNLKQIGIYSDPKRHPKQAINVAYGVAIAGIINTGDDAKEYRWFNLDELPELAFDHKKIIEDYRKIKDKTV